VRLKFLKISRGLYTPDPYYARDGIKMEGMGGDDWMSWSKAKKEEGEGGREGEGRRPEKN
jgi:hypothetical protein